MPVLPPSTPSTAWFFLQPLLERKPHTLVVSVVFREADVVESPPKVDLDVDTDRNDSVDNQADEDGEETWLKTRGANFIVNCDDDDGDGRPDAIVFDENVRDLAVYESGQVKGGDDAQEMAALKIQAPAVTIGYQFFLRMSADDLKSVHIYEGRQSGKKRIWGGWKENANQTGTLVKDITQYVSESSGVELALEGCLFAGQKINSYTFDGEVEVELVVQAATDATAIDDAKVVGTDKVKLRVAPVVFAWNGQTAEKIYATVSSGVFFGPDLSNQIDAQTSVPVEEVALFRFDLGNIWPQDYLEFGRMQKNDGSWMPVIVDLAHFDAAEVMTALPRSHRGNRFMVI